MDRRQSRKLCPIIAGIKKPHYFKEYELPGNHDNDLMSMSLPDLADFRQMAYMMRLRAELALEQGDVESAGRNALASMRLGRHIQSGPLVPEQLVGMAIGAIGLDAALATVSQADADILQQLQETMTALYPETFPKLDLKGDKYIILDSLQRTFSGTGVGGGHLIPARVHALLPAGEDNHFLLIMIASMYHARKDATRAKFVELYDRQQKLAKLTPYQRHMQEINFQKGLDQLSNRYLLIKKVNLDFSRVMDLSARFEANHKAVLTVLAIKQFERQQGHLPETLDELVEAGYLEAVAMDPFGPGALSYRLVEDDFVLYSFGYDLTDGGGKFVYDSSGQVVKFPHDGDFVFWPLPND